MTAAPARLHCVPVPLHRTARCCVASPLLRMYLTTLVAPFGIRLLCGRALRTGGGDPRGHHGPHAQRPFDPPGEALPQLPRVRRDRELWGSPRGLFSPRWSVLLWMAFSSCSRLVVADGLPQPQQDVHAESLHHDPPGQGEEPRGRREAWAAAPWPHIVG